MRYYKKFMRFMAAPNEGSGSTGNPSASQGGATEPNSQQQEIDPFAGIDLNDLDTDSRKVVEEGKKKFATLQKELAETKNARFLEEKQRKQFQSEHDKLRAQVDKLTKSGDPDPVETAKTLHIEKFEKILKARNVPADQARAQAELMHEMLGEFGADLTKRIKAEVGRDLGPMASAVITREAEFAWNQVEQSDNLGMLSVESVRNLVWSQVQAMSSEGQAVSPEVVYNLASMAYVKHVAAGGVAPVAPSTGQSSTTPAATMNQPPPPMPGFGRPAFSGAGAVPFQHRGVDPNAPKHALDANTDAALQVVFSKWDKKPSGFHGPKK